MKIVKFNNCTLTLRCPWLVLRNDGEARQVSIMADTIVGFWKWRVPHYVINWQLSVVVLGFGFQLTDEHPDPERKHKKAAMNYRNVKTP
jgi:hypothetical protein